MGLLFSIWILSVTCLCLHYLLFVRLVFHASSSPKVYPDGVSVIICARNEAENLKENLPLILQQKYPSYEVLVIDDRSDDSTREVLKELQLQYNQLKVIRHNGDKSYTGKKKALALGLENAGYSGVLLTDADCKPASDQWLRLMTSHFPAKDIVLGFGGLLRTKGWINTLQRWETLHTAVQYFSFALWGYPYMGVGRNLAYKLYIFRRSDKFQSHIAYPSGDDDLFIAAVAQAGNTAVELRSESFTFSEGAENLKKWWRQKRRHLSVAGKYRTNTKLLLAGYGGAQVLFYLLLPFLGSFYDTDIFVFLIAMKLALQLMIFLPLAIRFRSAEVMWLFPLWEILTALLLFIVHSQNILSGTTKSWK